MLYQQKQPSVLLPLFALFASMALLMVGNAYQGILLPVAGVQAQFSELALGILGTLYFAGYTLGSVFGPYVMSRVRHIRTFSTMAALACAMALLHALWDNVVWWWLCRFVTGFAIACLYTVIESWVNDRATAQNRGQMMGFYQMLAFATILLGQLLLLGFNPTDPKAFMLIAVLLALSVVPVSLSTNPQPIRQKAGLPPLRLLFKLAPAAVVSVAVVGAANGAFWSLGAVAGLKQGLSMTETTLLVSIVVLAGALCQFPIGKVADKLDRRMLMAAIFGLSIITGLLSAFHHPLGLNSEFELMLLAFLWGFTALGAYGVALAHAFDRMPTNLYVATSAAMLFLYGVGSVVGPLFASTLMSFFGPSMLYLATALLHGGGLVFLVYRLYIRPECVADQTSYAFTSPAIPVPASGQAEDLALQEQINTVENFYTADDTR